MSDGIGAAIRDQAKYGESVKLYSSADKSIKEKYVCPACNSTKGSPFERCGVCTWGPKDSTEKPKHYANGYPFEVDEAISLILSKLCQDLAPESCGHLYAELKYRFRAGLKEGNTAEDDIHKAMQFHRRRNQGKW